MKKIINVISIGVLVSSIILPSYASAVTVDSQPQSSISGIDNDNVIKDSSDVSIEDTKDMTRNSGKGNDTVNSSEEIGTETSNSLLSKEEINNIEEKTENSTFSSTTNNLSSEEDTSNIIKYATKDVYSDYAQIPEISISRKSNSQYSGISLWVSAKITNVENNIIKKGTKIIISGVSEEYFDFDNWSFVDGSAYGEYSVDPGKGQLIYTVNKDIDFSGSFTLNWFVPTKEVQQTTALQTLTGQYIDDKNSTNIDIENAKFQVTKTPGDAGIETRVQANAGNQGNIAVDNNAKNVSIDGYSIYDPNQKYLPVTYVLDPGNLTPSQTNRTYTISATGPNSEIIPSLIRVSIYDLGETNYLTLDQATSYGYLKYKINDDNSVSITWKDGIKIHYNRINVPLYAPNVTGKYAVTSRYTADTYYPGISITNLTNKVAYVPGSSAFIPKILGATDKVLKQGTDVGYLDDWLLKGVSATDLTDGNLTNQIEILDFNELKNAWEKHINGEFNVTYRVKNSQNQIATKQVKVTIYSDITIHYQDHSGNKIKEDLTLTGNPGESYVIDNSDITVNNQKYYFSVAKPTTLTGKYGDNGQPTEVFLTYMYNKQSISGSDFSMYVGDKTPTVSDFKATATDKDGKELEVAAD
ncbi:MucBP domain-containing protein, partial [Enterococcus faecalis]|uniref:MucBP domain-containing protein n=1 Tax=Enterococcus faecalis TaxID=1351 RepID=UPI004041C729